jgi:uncharacterized protein YutE (UPF0331/DUF86 family)
MNRDIIVNKTETIKRCLRRINDEYDGSEENLHQFTKQDSIVLNLQRACEACIDLAMHIVSVKELGVPQNSRDAFEMLYAHQFLDKALTARLKAMVGFRNIAVHDYQSIRVEILQSIIENHLNDFLIFTEKMKQIIRG